MAGFSSPKTLYMSYNLNSLKGVIWGIIYGTTIGIIKGDTRSLDYSSHESWLQAAIAEKEKKCEEKKKLATSSA